MIALPGMTELLLIFGVVLLLFGGRKLPQLGGAIGESIRNFKKGVKDDESKELTDGTKTEGTKSDGNPSQKDQQG
jgi:sec-independent protein translocase protein TatA